MSTMDHHHHSTRPSPLEIKQLAEFDAALGDLPDADKKRRRIVYLRDAMQQMGVQKSALEGFGLLLIPLILIPCFWPFVGFFWFMRKKARALMDAQLVNALEYWDLEGRDLQ
ncbi:hypothetical protein ACFL34_05215 [Candidatus Sumerlaeota bacterium]